MLSSFALGVLASGEGTNLQAILDTVHGSDGIAVVGVASDLESAKGLERARSAKIPTKSFPLGEHADRPARDDAIGDWLASLGVDLVVLAGYMKVLSPRFINRFKGRIINVHPSLLPAFPGLDAIGEAYEQGVKITGVTIHFVDDALDAGPIILQRPVPIPVNRDRAALEAAIHTTEHTLLPSAIRMISAGRLSIDPNNPRVVTSAPPT